MPTDPRENLLPPERRYDRGELLHPVSLPNGTLLVEGFAAREGILEYRRGDGSVRREFVPASTLAASAAGLARAPVTLLHPDPVKHADGVTPDNVAELGVGDVDGEVTVHADGFIRVKMALRRRDAIVAVRTKSARELSGGYDVVLDPTPGENQYGRYDAVQVERTYNHLALVPSGRAGRAVHVRADTAEATTTIGGSPPKHRGGTVNSRFLPLLTLLGISSRIDSDEEAIDACVDRLNKRSDAESSEKARADKAEALAATEAARADKAEAELASHVAAAQTRSDAEERSSLVALGGRMGLANIAADVPLPLLRRTVAQAHLGRDLRADASDDMIAGVIEAASAKHADGAEAETAATADHWRDDAAPVAPAKSKKSKSNDRWSGKRPGGGE